MRPLMQRRSSGCSANSTVAPWPCWSALFGDIDLAEEAVQDAFTVALERWPSEGRPPSPAGWIITTARNRAIDRLRREASRDDRQAQAALMQVGGEPRAGDEGAVRRRSAAADLHLLSPGARPERAGGADPAADRRPDDARDRSRLLWCPSRPWPSGWCVPRARSAMPASRFGYPARPTCRNAWRAVLAVVYLIFNEGYTASSGERLVRDDLCAEAIRLGRLLDELMPDEPEVMGLLALMLLIESRRGPPAPTADGELVLLADQDRRAWNAELIAEGQAIVRRCLRRDQPGPVSDPGRDQRRPQRRRKRGGDRLVADPAAVRPVACDRARDRSWRSTGRWPWPRSTARGRRSQWWTSSTWVTTTCSTRCRADLLRRAGRPVEATLAYTAAIERSDNDTERVFLQRRRDALANA